MDEKISRRPYRWREKPTKDKTGQKFNSLTIVGFSHYEPQKKTGRKLIWNCVCECGNSKKVENSNLICGNVSSCGCVQKTHLKKVHKNNIKNDIAFNYIFRDYIYSAKKRKYDFFLTYEEVKILTKQNCFYCGSEPKKIKSKNGAHVFKESYVYNGIDRKDNNLGYTKENCVSCCRICNIAKAELSIGEFYQWIKNIYEFNFINGVINPNIKLPVVV